MDFLILFLLVEIVCILLFLLPARIGSVWIMRGHYKQALSVFRAYYLMSRVIGPWRGPTLINLCACYVGLGNYERAQQCAEVAVREAGRRKQRQTLATARAYLGLTLLRQGQFAEAGELFDMALAETLPKRLRPHIEALAAHAYLNLDRLADAYALLSALQHYVPKNSELALIVQSNLSWYYGLQERWEEAREAAREASKHPTQRQDLRASVIMMNVICATEMGDLETAKAESIALISLQPHLDAYRQGACLRALGLLALRQGDLDRARDYAERAAGSSLNPNAYADVLLIQAEVFAARHNAHRARALCEEIGRTQAASFYKNRAAVLLHRLSTSSTASSVPVFTPEPTLPRTEANPAAVRPRFAPETATQSLQLPGM